MPSPDPIGAPSGMTGGAAGLFEAQREHRVVVGVGSTVNPVRDQQLCRLK